MKFSLSLNDFYDLPISIADMNIVRWLRPHEDVGPLRKIPRKLKRLYNFIRTIENLCLSVELMMSGIDMAAITPIKTKNAKHYNNIYYKKFILEL